MWILIIPDWKSVGIRLVMIISSHEINQPALVEKKKLTRLPEVYTFSLKEQNVLWCSVGDILRDEDGSSVFIVIAGYWKIIKNAEVGWKVHIQSFHHWVVIELLVYSWIQLLLGLFLFMNRTFRKTRIEHNFN